MRPVLAALMLMCASVATAEVRPIPGPGDPRIQLIRYDVDQVIDLQVANGYLLTVEFGPDERVENIAVGDSNAWQVTPNKRGDHLFIKAGQGAATTNMVVVTDARTYTFTLSSTFGGPGQALTVRFQVPPPVVVTVPTIPADDLKPGRYHLSGATSLRPSAIDDDGVHTYIQWPANRSLPAVFSIDPQGNETLINGMVREGRFVIDSVSNRLVFRFNRETAYASRRPRLALH